MRATVQTISDRGFVFVVTDTGNRVFVHATRCDFPFDILEKGDVVEIDNIEKTYRGWHAGRCQQVP